MLRIAMAGACAALLLVSPAAAQKQTLEELLKPYDAKTTPSSGAPPAVPLAAGSSLCRCTGCGCKGGPGWRGPNGQCVSHASLTKDCGSPPSARCTYEGARQVCGR
jgi:hypothetical protein